MTSFSEVNSLLKKTEDGFSFDVTEDWLNGRTAYGGLTAALCVAATQKSFDALPPLRSAQFAFLAPSSSSLSVRSTLLRQGRSTTFVEANITSHETLTMKAVLCFAMSRDIQAQANLEPPSSLLEPDRAPTFTFKGTIPSYLSHFETRLAKIDADAVTAKNPEILLWIRHADSGVSNSVLSLVSTIDAIPAPAAFLINNVAFVSTVTWSLDVVTDDFASSGGWWLTQTKADHVGSSFTSQNTTIWNTDGRLIALYRQTLAVSVRP